MARISEAKKKANAKWNKANKDKQKIYQYRSNARKFIKEYASKDDLEKMQDMIAKRLNEVNK